jgi:Protein kinase domain/WD40-like Beta Propeller Repeat
MGEVYRARDTRMDRAVAIKILPAQFSSDAARRQRFEREAKTISQLNHPHICVLHDVGHQDGVDYLVMECVQATLTDFDGVEQAAAVSRDGHFVAFLSERDGQMDVWVTQVGSGQFHNLTRGSAPELVNPSVRTLGFSPDGSLFTFWVRRQDASRGRAVPTLGGQAKPYLERVAELD